ncbi:MAG: tRNA-uridine aminocarboxypropyltransferase [Thermoguttaceae bacterium]
MDETQYGQGSSEPQPRGRCYGCFRPLGDCFCAAIPTIDNRTDVLIVQHVRERFHPFNTARMVHRALKKSQLVVDQTARLAAARLPLQPGAVLLYPGPESQLLHRLPREDRPRQLVMVDGTWQQVRTLLRNIPALGRLPRCRLQPALPGRYRIRREISETSLSTVEAAVAALRELEPETAGLERLLEAFEIMVERQLAHRDSHTDWRRNRRRGRTVRGISRTFARNLDSVVVAYGEASFCPSDRKGAAQLPISWVAERLGTGEGFSSTIHSQRPLAPEFLAHLELSSEAFTRAVPIAQFRAAWQAFVRPGDTLAVYSRGTARLLEHAGADIADCLVLKSIQLTPGRPNGYLDQLLADHGIVSPVPRYPGRAGRRLANAVAMVRHLHTLASL